MYNTHPNAYHPNKAFCVGFFISHLPLNYSFYSLRYTMVHLLCAFSSAVFFFLLLHHPNSPCARFHQMLNINEMKYAFVNLLVIFFRCISFLVDITIQHTVFPVFTLCMCSGISVRTFFLCCFFSGISMFSIWCVAHFIILVSYSPLGGNARSLFCFNFVCFLFIFIVYIALPK